MTFWRKLRRYPPILCRLLARHRYGRILSDEEISVRAGLAVYEVAAIGAMTSWDDVPVGKIRSILIGMGIDLCNMTQMKRVESYLRAQARLAKLNRPNWRYLRRDTEWQRRWAPAMSRYLQSLKR